MRYLVISDLHANWEGLQAVLDATAKERYDRIICCGDLVGYGADPNPVSEWVRCNVKDVVRGNHDRACVGLEDLEWFNPVARTSAVWTANTLTVVNAEYLRLLPRGPRMVDEFQILHGSPVDEDEYLIQAGDAAQVVSYLDRRISFFGHTHIQGGFAFHRMGVAYIRQRGDVMKGDRQELRLDPDSYYLINPGSVGQPRDGDPRAAWCFYSPEERLVEFRRVSYDVPKAQDKIRNAGLPDLLARRLALGQ